MLSYLIACNPFVDRVQNVMEILNELTFLIVTYSFILFTDYNLNSSVKVMMGWFMIGVTLLNIAINYLVVLIKTFL